jgi:DNA repair protein RadC
MSISAAHIRLRDVPSNDRPRERLREHGPHALSTAELLAIILGSGTGGRSVLDVAHSILAAADGSLRRLAAQPMSALRKTAGVGPVRALTVHAALELGRRLTAEERREGVPIRSPRDIFRLYSPRLEDLPVEEFHVAVLDVHHRLERDITVTRGLLDSSLVHPREVYRQVIAENAAAVILVHNHPSGDPTPSPDDRNATEQMVQAGRVLGIPVQDHVIIGRGRFVSFAEAGLL